MVTVSGNPITKYSYEFVNLFCTYASHPNPHLNSNPILTLA